MKIDLMELADEIEASDEAISEETQERWNKGIIQAFDVIYNSKYRSDIDFPTKIAEERVEMVELLDYVSLINALPQSWSYCFRRGWEPRDEAYVFEMIISVLSMRDPLTSVENSVCCRHTSLYRATLAAFLRAANIVYAQTLTDPNNDTTGPLIA